MKYSPLEALQELRGDPDKAFANCAFMVDNSKITDNAGCNCCVEITQLIGAKHENMFLLTLRPDVKGGDYFYPYVAGGGGIGSNFVPACAPKGTLVFTGGMNGCSIQVDEVGDALMFMHCQDGCNVPVEKSLGRKVARVDYKDYAGPKGISLRMLSSSIGFNITERKEGFAYYYSYHLISIKRDSEHVKSSLWVIYGNCILQVANLNKPKVKAYYKIPGTTINDLYFIATFMTRN